MTRAPQPGGTTARGLGYHHRQQRRRLLDTTPDGTPCAHCGNPMYPRTAPNELDADHEVARSHGGTQATRLLHSTCNRARGNGTLPHRTSQEW